MMPRPECPIYRRSEAAGEEAVLALRRLKKLRRVCRRCPRQVSCDVLRSLQEWVGRAAEEALDELGG